MGRYRIDRSVRDDDSYFYSDRTVTFEVVDQSTGKVIHVFSGGYMRTSLGEETNGTKSVLLMDGGRALLVTDYDGTSRQVSLPESKE